jgi:hypothetical protein
LAFQAPADPAQGALAAAAGDGAGSLFWLRESQQEGLALARDQARSVQLARSLLRRLPLAKAQDALFAADSGVACALAWEHATRSLRVRSRAPLRIERIERDGRSTSVNLADGIQLQPRDCRALCLPAGWRLALEPQVEETGA